MDGKKRRCVGESTPPPASWLNGAAATARGSGTYRDAVEKVTPARDGLSRMAGVKQNQFHPHKRWRPDDGAAGVGKKTKPSAMASTSAPNGATETVGLAAVQEETTALLAAIQEEMTAAKELDEQLESAVRS
uniref:Uncharacterized protein n=2 Tax=Pinguiococcus pyrenoidosus TaxID=172671 RepID=A0A7R9U4T4_9STRA|mmetsp:Transcript_1485/g.6496  ORF Transcript_1485/g.6496 Transcript_1485/m.6496 type:complete len:132 (+) Transcript_1485:280-675(+)